jgi:hypothetical protein
MSNDNAPDIRRSLSVYKNMRDPSLLKYYSSFHTIELMQGDELQGTSPPDIFIGSFGYPNVYIGPLVTPISGDTSLFSTPELWTGHSISDIIEFRANLIRGMYKTNVKNVETGRIEESVKELALSSKYVDSTAVFSQKPEAKMIFNDDSQPFGPSGKIKAFEIQSNISSDKYLQKANSDVDMTSTEAMKELYANNMPVSKIQKALSAGLLGRGSKRKFVPTRWSITAVDDILSKANLSRVKEYESIDKIRIYEYYALDNRWIVIMLPGIWNYELVEAWYPKTTWNEKGRDIAIYSSYEFNDGRKKYAEIGGCYYAARLAVSELLDKEQKQASAIILRETHPGYTLPVGVWNVREHVRMALKQEYHEFNSLKEALPYIQSKLEIKIPDWMKNSSILRYMFSQKKLFP